MVTVEQVMTKGVVVLRSDATLRDAIACLATQHVSGAPVLNARRRLVGVVTTSDILQAESEGANLAATSLQEIMSSPPLTVAPSTELREAALAMEYADVHRLFVATAGELVGVVSRSDVSRALATGRI